MPVRLLGLDRTRFTNGEGDYLFLSVPPNDAQDIALDLEGFNDIECLVPMKTVTVEPGETTRVDFECFTEQNTGNALTTGTKELTIITFIEQVFDIMSGQTNGTGNSASRSKFLSTSQQDEVQFGDLTGTFPVAVAGAEGFVVIDLLDGEVLLDETDGTIEGPPLFGVIGLSQEPPGPGSAHAFAFFGQNGINMIDTQDCCGQLANQPPAFDAVPTGGNLFSGYAATVGTDGVNFIFYDEAQDLYRFTFFSESGIPANRFDGQVISVWMPDDGTPEDTPVLVLTRETESGVYLAKRDGSNPVRAIENIGFDARKLRCIDDGSGSGNLVCSASIFGHDRLGLLTWDGESLPTLTDFAEVGDGPVGIDMRLLKNGNIAVVSTGFNDNTVTVTVVAPNGIVQSSNTRPVLEGCQSPGHAIFVQDAESLKMVGTCYDSSNYFIMESEL